MEIGTEENSVTIKVLTVNGKRMPRAIYHQLPRLSMISEDDGTLQGQPWGTVIEQKCCRESRRPVHWHLVHQRNGELAVWDFLKDAGCPLRPDDVYLPPLSVGGAFLAACTLEAHHGHTDFFQGKLFNRLRGEEVITTIEDVKVALMRSPAVDELVRAKDKHQAEVQRQNQTVQRGTGGSWPSTVPMPDEAAKERLEEVENALHTAEEHVLKETAGNSAQELYSELVADVRTLKQARTSYAAAVELAGQLPQLFLGA